MTENERTLSYGNNLLYEAAAGHFGWLANHVASAEEGMALVVRMTRTVEEIRQRIENRFAAASSAVGTAPAAEQGESE